MSKKEQGHFILGTSCNGIKFRPSDWMERIATAFGYFDANHRLRYHPKVTPARHEGERCLFLAGSLLLSDPLAYKFIMDFANSNQLQIINAGQPDMPEPPLELQNVA